MDERALLEMRETAWRLAVRILRASEGAEDVVQEAYLAALRQLRAGSPPRDARAWFLKIVANTARMRLRGEARRRRREEAVSQELGAARDGRPGDELIELLRRAIDQLEEKYRLPVALCYEEGLSQREAAEALEIPERNVSHFVKVGLEKLRDSLARAGYMAAPAVIVGALSHTAPPVPATLLAAIEKIIAGQVTAVGSGSGSGAAAASAAAKGGIAMKIVLGVVVAGVLAGTMGLMGIGPMRSPPANPAAAGPQKFSMEHYAFAFDHGYIDGARRSAAGGGYGFLDDDFNCYIHRAYQQGEWSLRCIRATDDLVVTLAGSDYWVPDFGTPQEGPASAMPRLSGFGGFGYSQDKGGVISRGMPWAGKGYLLAFNEKEVWKVWRNASKGNRWWFKRVAGDGKEPLPTEAGQSIAAAKAAIRIGANNAPQVLRDGSIVLFTPEGFYRYEEREDGDRLTCLLSLDSIAALLPKNKDGKPARPGGGVIDSGGYFYLDYYRSAYGSDTIAKIQRLAPDGKKLEPYATSAKGAPNGRDGPALESGWFCGPWFLSANAASRWYPPGVIVGHAHDEGQLRRIKDGRVSTLYDDGEWREADVCGQKGENGQAPLSACNYVPGPKGMGLVDGRLFRGVDFAKESVKKLGQ